MTEFGPTVTSLDVLEISASDIVQMSFEQLRMVAIPNVLAAPNPATCDHKNFSINFEMGKNEGGYVARVRLWCSACGQPFFFSGLSREPSDVKPHIEMEGTQVHLPLGAYYGPVTTV